MTSSAVSQRFQFLAVDALARHGSSSSLPTMHTYLYTKYDEKMDFLGKNLIGLIDAPKAKVKAMIPVLRDASEMEQRLGSAQELQDYHVT